MIFRIAIMIVGDGENRIVIVGDGDSCCDSDSGGW